MVLSNAQIKEVKKLASELNTNQIADYFGICRDTFRLIRKRQPEVFRQYKKGRANKIRKYEKQLDKKIFKTNAPGDTTALIFALKTIGGWSEKQVIETHNQTVQKRFVLEVDNGSGQD